MQRHGPHANSRWGFSELVDHGNFRPEVKRVAEIEPSFVPGRDMGAAIRDVLNQPNEVSRRAIG